MRPERIQVCKTLNLISSNTEVSVCFEWLRQLIHRAYLLPRTVFHFVTGRGNILTVNRKSGIQRLAKYRRVYSM